MRVVWDDIWSWMVFGHLRDSSQGDFFISEKSSEAVLLVDDLPSFISMRAAEKIFFSGQLVRYFNSCHQDHGITPIFESTLDEKFESVREISSAPFKVRPFNLMIESIRKEAVLVSVLNAFVIISNPFFDGRPLHINEWPFRIEGNIDLSPCL